MKKIIVSADQKPPLDNAGWIFSFERGLDPWHRDAFPAHLQDQIADTGPRTEGWFGLDWVGNPIYFIPDGTEIEVPEENDNGVL
jgi:hypothetical protein